MARQFRRECRLTLDTYEVRGLTRDRGRVNPGLSVSFRVESTLKRTPNTAEVQVLNLSQSTREHLGRMKEVPVKLEAGYEGAISTVFLGALRIVESTWRAPEWYTVVRSGDGEQAVRTARVNTAFEGRVSLSEAIQAVAKSMKVGIGNAVAMAAKGKFVDGSNAFLQSAVLSGASADVLDGLLESSGIEWSVQGGELQLLERGKPLRPQAVLLSGDTGLLESKLDTKNVVTFRSLMNPDIRPGCVVTIDSPALKTSMRVEQAVYIGDTAADDWFVDGTGKAI